MISPEYQTLWENYPDTAVVFGDNPGPSLIRLLLERRSRRIALFTGRHSVDETGIFSRFARLTAEVPVTTVRFREISPEPDVETIERMTAFLRAENPDTVIALGGGSVMDAAKAAYLVYQAGGTVADYFGSDRYTQACPGGNPDRVICFPTTSGTGSEVTLYSNIVDRRLGVKKLISDPAIIPACSFVIPDFAASMPRAVTLATGCDALAHLIEGFLNIGQDGRHAAANDWALTGIRLIERYLPEALDAPGADSRAAMAAASCLGGMVIRYKSTGLPHLCSFSWFGRIAHGLAVVMLLPAAWEFYLGRPEVAERTMLLRSIFPGDSPEAVVASFRKVLSRCGVPESLGAFPEITPELLERTARSAAENPMKLQLAPRPVPLEDSCRIISEILRKS